MVMTEFTKRFLTALVLIAGFTLFVVMRAFAGAFGVYVFDILIFAAAGIGTLEICNARKLNHRGANIVVALIVDALIYMFYIIGSQVLKDPIPWWLQLIVSLTTNKENMKSLSVDRFIKTLLNQTLRPYKILLSIKKKDITYLSNYLLSFNKKKYN